MSEMVTGKHLFHTAHLSGPPPPPSGVRAISSDELLVKRVTHLLMVLSVNVIIHLPLTLRHIPRTVSSYVSFLKRYL